jgi:glycosyltransferase involved in cell wall biosynthesis
MKISIITATFNSRELISSNVESILLQNYENWEHLIIDNLSTDGTIPLVQSLYQKANLLDNLKIISEKDLGISDAFNKGIGLASGEIILILSSDDYLLNNHVFQDVERLFHEGWDIVHGDVLYLDPEFGNQLRSPLLCPIELAMPFNHPAMFYKKSVFETYGLFDLHYRFTMDYEHTARFYQSADKNKCRTYYYPEALVALRAGGASSRNEIRSIQETKAFLKKYDHWSFRAKVNYVIRLLRIRMKFFLVSLGFGQVITFWRNYKWQK